LFLLLLFCGCGGVAIAGGCDRGIVVLVVTAAAAAAVVVQETFLSCCT